MVWQSVEGFVEAIPGQKVRVLVASDGKHYLEESPKSVKMEWAYEIKKGLEAGFQKR